MCLPGKTPSAPSVSAPTVMHLAFFALLTHSLFYFYTPLYFKTLHFIKSRNNKRNNGILSCTRHFSPFSHTLFFHFYTSFTSRPFISQVTQQQRNKGEDNSSIDDTRNAVLLLQADYKANHRCFHPSPRRRPGPRSRQLLRRVHIPLLPSTTRRTDEPDNRLQTSLAPQSTAVQRQRLPCLWVGDREPERQHGEDR